VQHDPLTPLPQIVFQFYDQRHGATPASKVSANVSRPPKIR
jgi:hypothetical protein